jgi:hypothetical protein
MHQLLHPLALLPNNNTCINQQPDFLFRSLNFQRLICLARWSAQSCKIFFLVNWNLKNIYSHVFSAVHGKRGEKIVQLELRRHSTISAPFVFFNPAAILNI